MDEQAAKEWQDYKRRPSVDEFRNRLVDRYYPLVLMSGNRIKKNLPESVPIEDLFSAGVFGLVDAIKAFDLSRGVKFETYSLLRIRGAMLDELRHMDWVPRLVRSRATKLSNAADAFQTRTGRPPGFEELADELSITELELEAMLAETKVPGLGSIYFKMGNEFGEFREKEVIDTVENEQAEMPVLDAGRMDFIRTVTRGLNKSERIIFLQYYVEGDTMKQIGKQLDLSESRVSQMHSAVIDRMRSSLSCDELQALID